MMTDKEYADFNQMIDAFCYGVDIRKPEYESGCRVWDKYGDDLQSLYDDLVDYNNKHPEEDGSCILFLEGTFHNLRRKENKAKTGYVNVYTV